MICWAEAAGPSVSEGSCVWYADEEEAAGGGAGAGAEDEEACGGSEVIVPDPGTALVVVAVVPSSALVDADSAAISLSFPVPALDIVWRYVSAPLRLARRGMRTGCARLAAKSSLSTQGVAVPQRHLD